MKVCVSLHQKGGSSAATSFGVNSHLHFTGYWRKYIRQSSWIISMYRWTNYGLSIFTVYLRNEYIFFDVYEIMAAMDSVQCTT